MKSKEKASIDLLMLPGWAIPTGYYFPLLSSIKTKVRTRVFDYGFFPASPSKASMRVPELSANCAPLVIVAHSLGSLFAFKLAASNPSVKALILFGAFARFAAGGAIPGRNHEDIDAMRKHLVENPEVLLKSFYRASASPEPLKIPPPEILNLKALSEGLEILATDDVSSLMPAVTPPCLDFISSNDLIVDAPMSSALSALLPKMQTRSFQAVGHLLPLTKPQESAKAIDEFLATVLSEGA